MDQGFHYIPYKSRRNSYIKDEETLSLLNEYSCDIQLLQQTTKAINLEIGFGAGEFILSKAIENPNNIYLGCEVYNPGIIKLIKNLKRNNIQNVLIYRDDIRELLINTVNLFFNDIYILFPDPWPKKRHHKRRLINASFLQFIRKKFRSDLHIATDHERYAENILYDIIQSNDYKIKTLKIKKEKSLCTKFEDGAISKSSCVFYFVLNHR